MDQPAAPAFDAGERESQLSDLARFGSTVVTEVVPHYVQLVASLSAIDPQDTEAETIIGGLEEICLRFGVPLIRTSRMLSERGAALAAGDPVDDPRALLPLLRAVGESYISLAGIGELADVPRAFPVSPDSISELLDDPQLNSWLLAQHSHGRLPVVSG